MDIVIISIVSLIAIAGHVWIYRWVKFKVQEGAILEVLGNDDSGNGLTAAAIAVAAQLHADRINEICERSRQISRSDSGHWHSDRSR
jgi:ABC-type transporter Mla maintaining outer membrane lipid asymmetry ATPase subunit MlaF